jgi:uncharacterized protein YndB with AHSA1/START domain
MTPIEPVRASVTVQATPERSFEVFTAEQYTWWPRTHHIGKSPVVTGYIEEHVGGRCYTEHVDGSEVDWGKVLVWEPPDRLVLAWQITHQWGYNPDLAQASEVEVRFTAVEGGATRVDLEHRYFERMGAGGETMRAGVSGGWPTLLGLFAAQCQAAAGGARG